MGPTPAATGRRPDGTTDHAACIEAATAPMVPTVNALQSAWVGRPGWDRLFTRLRAAWVYHARLRRRHMRLEVPATRVPDCPACRNSCCRSPHLVSLRLTDIARLHDIGLGWAVSTSHPDERSEIYVHHPELRAAERRPAFREFPVLRHTEKGACVFLDPDERCSIYPQRPLACQAFPYRLDENLESVRYSTGCQSSRADGSPKDQEALAAAVAANFDAKARDLLTLQFDHGTLLRLDLGAYLPRAERGRRFGAAIRRYK